MRADQTGRKGVESVRSILINDVGWYPREPVAPDRGIDLYAEGSAQGDATGRLIAIQVKAGPNYFKESTADGWIYRGERRHLAYWTRHSLPVIVVLYDPDSRHAYWAHVTPEVVTHTSKGWKMTVPRNQRLGAQAAEPLEAIADEDPYILGLRSLQSAVSWMTLLSHGGELAVEATEWVNKTSGRGEIRLIAASVDGTRVVRGSGLTRQALKLRRGGCS